MVMIQNHIIGVKKDGNKPRYNFLENGSFALK